jgi:WD40 repeat protein
MADDSTSPSPARGTETACSTSEIKARDLCPFLLRSGDASQISAMAFSQEGDQLLTGSVDGKARLWWLHEAGVDELKEMLKALPRPCLEKEELQQELTEQEVQEELQECGRRP